jgi:hypothetical protein
MIGKSMRLGGGGRFEAMKQALSRKPGIKNPAAVAAAAGIKKYGKAKMEDMAEAGKKRAEE